MFYVITTENPFFYLLNGIIILGGQEMTNTWQDGVCCFIQTQESFQCCQSGLCGTMRHNQWCTLSRDATLSSGEALA